MTPIKVGTAPVNWNNGDVPDWRTPSALVGSSRISTFAPK